MQATAISAAAGSGRRVGSDTTKQMLDIGGGSMLQHSVTAFLAHPRISEVIVVVPAGTTARSLFGADPTPLRAVRVVPGGERRQDSVARAFDYVAASADVGLIREPARPLLARGLIGRTSDRPITHRPAISGG